MKLTKKSSSFKTSLKQNSKNHSETKKVSLTSTKFFENKSSEAKIRLLELRIDSSDKKQL
jgi:hypothetical protein